jgi:glyoxylase-like metal-dependent hydrolase (beta-lactamase superfamily II)
MKYRSALKILVIVGILFSFVNGITEYRNQVLALEFSLLLTVIWITEYYLFKKNEIPKISDFKIDLGELRELVDTEKNRLPVRLNSLMVAEGEIPDWIVVAGGAPSGFPISFTSFQVVYDDKTVIIECPFDRVLYDRFCRYKVLGIKGKYFNEENYEIMQRAMLEAEYIVATHEHWDHVGGIAQSPYVGELLKKTVLTTEQVHGRTIKAAGFLQGTFDDYTPLEYDQYHILAPGIVLIKAPGHSVGSQMIFVRLRYGEEFLFIGDVGWNMVNIERLSNHSRMGMLLRHEDGEQLGHQIRWLYENAYNNPDEEIHLMTSHDPSQIEDYTRTGLIREKFE